MIAAYYRGRTTFKELMELPIADINILFDIANERSKQEEKEGKAGQRQLAEQIEDEMG